MRLSSLDSYGLTFDDLYRREGLLALDGCFLTALRDHDAQLHDRLVRARAGQAALTHLQESELLLELAPHLERFVACLFGIKAEADRLAARHHELAPLYAVKRQFVQRKALHAYKAEQAQAFDGMALERELEAAFGEPFTELAFARHVTRWQETEEPHATRIDVALRYAAWAVHTDAGRHRRQGGVLFKVPAKLDQAKLVPVVTDETAGYKSHRLDGAHLRRRAGFKLTDPGADLAGALDEANYCIWCHHQAKDSCSKGLKEKGAPGSGAASFKKSGFGVTLAGCVFQKKVASA